MADLDILRAISLSLLLESSVGITDKLLGSMFKDIMTLPVQGRVTASAYFAWYSIRGLAAHFFINSVAFLCSWNEAAEVVSSMTHDATLAKSLLKFVCPDKYSEHLRILLLKRK